MRLEKETTLHFRLQNDRKNGNPEKLLSHPKHQVHQVFHVNLRLDLDFEK